MDDTPEERGRKRKKKEKSCQPSPPSFAQRRTFRRTFEFDWSKSARIKSPEITGQLRNLAWNEGICVRPGWQHRAPVLARRRRATSWLCGLDLANTHTRTAGRESESKDNYSRLRLHLLVLNEDVQVQGKEGSLLIFMNGYWGEGTWCL